MFRTRTARIVDAPEAPTTDLHIPKVLGASICVHHQAGLHEPCYDVQGLTGSRIQGVCNHRAKLAGMTGHINPLSLMTNRTRSAERS